MTIAHFSRRCHCATMLAALGLLVVSLCAAPIALAQQNLVYVMSNIPTAGQNAIQGFANDGNGNLTPLPGSPYATGGTGTGAASNGTDLQWDSDGEIAINAAGTLLFSVNGGSNDISVFTINADGSLTPNSGSPFASGGQDPASLALRENVFPNGGSFMAVVNKDSDPNQSGGVPSYTTFTVDSSGTMNMNAGSTLDMPVGTTPSQALMRPNGRVQFFGIEFMNNTVATYQTNGKGILTQVSSSVPPVTFPMVLGAVLHPTQKGMYVALPFQNQIAVYTYNSAGALTFRKAVPNPGQAPCWLAINAAGNRLYDSETPVSTMTVYDLSNPLKPVRKQHLAFEAGALPAHMRLDPTGKFLYVLDRTGILRVLDVLADGTVSNTRTPVSLNLPIGTTPIGLAVLSK